MIGHEATDFSRRHKMKRFVILILVLLLIGILGCDGDGDGTVAIDTTTEEAETVEGPKGPVTIATGSEYLGGLEYFYIPFSIPETGIIKATVEWSSPPLKLDVYLHHFGSGAFVPETSIQSPATVLMQATQDLLDNSDEWTLEVQNNTSDAATVNYTITFYVD
jgi:hypothetical protein